MTLFSTSDFLVEVRDLVDDNGVGIPPTTAEANLDARSVSNTVKANDTHTDIDLEDLVEVQYVGASGQNYNFVAGDTAARLVVVNQTDIGGPDEGAPACATLLPSTDSGSKPANCLLPLVRTLKYCIIAQIYEAL